MKRLLLALAATASVLNAGPALPQTTTQPSISEPGMQLVVLASILRLDMADGPGVALARLQPDERAALAGVVGQPRDAGRWATLIGPATQFVHVEGDSAESAWWNPLADAGLVLHWRRGPDRWRLDGAAPFTGAALRGSPAARSGNLAQSLRATSAATRQAVSAGAGAGILSRRPPAEPALAAAAAVAASTIIRGDGAGVNADRMLAAAALLTSGRIPQRGPNGGVGGFLAQVPSEARARFQPIARYSDDAGVTVVWGSPGLPNTLLALRYPADAPRAVVPADVTVIDLIVARGEQP